MKQILPLVEAFEFFSQTHPKTKFSQHPSAHRAAAMQDQASLNLIRLKNLHTLQT